MASDARGSDYQAWKYIWNRNQRLKLLVINIIHQSFNELVWEREHSVSGEEEMIRWRLKSIAGVKDFVCKFLTSKELILDSFTSTVSNAKGFPIFEKHCSNYRPWQVVLVAESSQCQVSGSKCFSFTQPWMGFGCWWRGDWGDTYILDVVSERRLKVTSESWGLTKIALYSDVPAASYVLHLHSAQRLVRVSYSGTESGHREAWSEKMGKEMAERM